MHFREDAVQEFQALFNERKEQIRNFAGCMHLELWQDKNDPCLFFTYSKWNNEVSLNHYRFSDLFKDTWSLTKALFDAKPEAWSIDQLYMLP